MKTIAAFYTAQSLLKPVSEEFSRELPDCRLINIVDDGFIADVIANDGVDDRLARRLLNYYFAAEAAGADYIFNTCSSIGDLVFDAQTFVSIPIVRIDTAMAVEAVGNASKIAVLATLPTTLGPTANLVRREAARLGREITLVEGLAEGAFAALQSGDVARHNDLIMKTAAGIGDQAEVFLLAQGSMSPMEEPLREKTGKRVLTSLRSGIRYLKEVVDHG